MPEIAITDHIVDEQWQLKAEGFSRMLPYRSYEVPGSRQQLVGPPFNTLYGDQYNALQAAGRDEAWGTIKS